MAKKFWTPGEDKYFLKTVISVVGEKSGTLNDAFEAVSKKLGRSVPGCQARYKNTIRGQVPQTVLEKISENNPRNASLKSESYEEEEYFPIFSNLYNEEEDAEGQDLEDQDLEEKDSGDGDPEVDGFDEEIFNEDEVSPVDEDFSDVPALIDELITLDARRKIIKERVKKYHEFIGGVLTDK